MADEIEDFHRELERRYIKHEKELNEREVGGGFIIELINENDGTAEPLGIVIPGKDLEIESEEF